jgi:hypothetical protein
MKMLTEVLEDQNRRGNRAPGMAGGMKKKTPFFMGKSRISMAMFNSYVCGYFINGWWFGP